MGNLGEIETDVRRASRRQIHAAIGHLRKSEFEAAISLANAAEEVLAVADKSNLFETRRTAVGLRPWKIDEAIINDFVDWIKHGENGKAKISEFQVIATIGSTISKFVAVYHEPSLQMMEFHHWAIARIRDYVEGAPAPFIEGILFPHSGGDALFSYPQKRRPLGSAYSTNQSIHRYRSHTCGELRTADIGETVRISGWCHRIRDHGGVLFIDLRDHYGMVQVVADPSSSAFQDAETLRSEWVVRIDGWVRARPEGTENPELPTGELEIHATDVEVLGRAGELPMPVFGDQEYPEDIRLKYRFLDLRREHLHRNIMKRGDVIDWLRRRMREQGFFEFQTPILTASSPEGARDYLVPSRLHPGKFYALPQAPQQFKQLIMISGFDRYFQIAPCFRDEDARADRSPGEFYQLDIEMSFVTQDDVFAAVEPVLRGVFEEFGDGKPVTQKFPLIPFKEAMLKYGTDKPDLRNPLLIADVSEEFNDPTVSFNAFRNVIKTGGVVRAIRAPDVGRQPRSFFDKLNEWAKTEMGAQGLGYIAFEQGTGRGEFEFTPQDESVPVLVGGRGPIAKFIPQPVLNRLAEKTGIKPGDALFFSAGKEVDAAKLAGVARTKIGQELGLIDKDRFDFCWIVDFPMYEWNEQEKKIDFSHNPFSMPNMPAEEFLKLDPADHERLLGLRAVQYDVVCNGVELSSGAIRNHRPDVMKKAFAIAGYPEDVLEQKFGGMLHALSLGAPPHGGIAPGIDRIVMLLCGEDNLREVVLFPMNQRAEDLMMGAPSEVSAKQLRELHIRLSLPQE